MELLFVLRPFFTVKEVFCRFAAAVEEPETTPFRKTFRTVLLNGATGERDAFLDETTERSDTLLRRKIYQSNAKVKLERRAQFQDRS
jgi:hypothetical protein